MMSETFYRSRHILLAERDPALRAKLVSALADDGVRVTDVGDGRALRERLLAEHGDLDLVVTDVSLPELGGLDALEECARAGVRIPTVLLSSRADELVARAAFRFGALALLSKPFPVLDLCIVVEFFAHRHRASYRRAA
jgi:CheY-like chemotaxis protein